MPAYSYVCPNCEEEYTIHKGMHISDWIEICDKCEAILRRDYQADNIHAARGAGRDYHTSIVSHSMAIHPDQIAGHQKMYPDVKVQGDGCLVFDNYSTHDKYMEKRGIVKHPQRQKRRGKAI